MTNQQADGEPELDAAAIVAALNRHQVRYVVIGVFAAIAQQAPIPATRDIDLTPEPSQENLTRLSLALKELGARIRTEAVPDGLPFSHDATSLAAADVWSLICPDGEFDISFYPSGFEGGYAQLALNAHRLRVGEVEVVVADLADVIRSKESAGRPKDLRVLPLLYRHQSTRRAGMDDGQCADLGAILHLLVAPRGLDHRAPTFLARSPPARSFARGFPQLEMATCGRPRLPRSSEPEVMAMHAKDMLGKSGEQAAAEYLESCGLRILDRNWRCAVGEIDIVAAERYALVVVEVKSRTSLRYGSPLEAVSRAKRARLRRLAVQWLNAHGVRFDQVRIDVVGLVYDGTGGFSIEHIRGVG